MKLAVIYDSKTGNTSAMAECICEGMRAVEGVEAKAFNYKEIDMDFTKGCSGFVFGCPTYMAGPTADFYEFLERDMKKLGVGGKLGGVFATEQYIHGGADLTMVRILEHLLVFGMMVYSGGNNYGHPIIHIGPVEVSPKKEDFEELFRIYGNRFAKQAISLGI